MISRIALRANFGDLLTVNACRVGVSEREMTSQWYRTTSHILSSNNSQLSIIVLRASNNYTTIDVHRRPSALACAQAAQRLSDLKITPRTVRTMHLLHRTCTSPWKGRGSFRFSNSLLKPSTTSVRPAQKVCYVYIHTCMHLVSACK